MPELILNPNARQLRSRPDLVNRIRLLARKRATVWVTPTLDDLDAAAATIAARGADRVALCGGDGTFMAGLSSLSARGLVPPLALIPAGTVSTVARQWGFQGEPTALIDRFVRLGPDAATDERATLFVQADGVTRRGFTFGTGLVARFFERYYAGNAGGLPAAAGIFARVFVGSLVADAYSRSVLDPLPCRLSVEGRQLPAEAYSLILASVLPSVGLGLRVAYRAGEDPERPHLVASALPAARLGPQAPRVLAGRALKGAGGFDGLVEAFSLQFSGTGPYVFDGDLFQAHQIHVSAGPRIHVVRLSGA